MGTFCYCGFRKRNIKEIKSNNTIDVKALHSFVTHQVLSYLQKFKSDSVILERTRHHNYKEIHLLFGWEFFPSPNWLNSARTQISQLHNHFSHDPCLLLKQKKERERSFISTDPSPLLLQSWTNERTGRDYRTNCKKFISWIARFHFPVWSGNSFE